jgi:hypothetical protein
VLAPNYLGGGSNKFRFSLTQQQVPLPLSACCSRAASCLEQHALIGSQASCVCDWLHAICSENHRTHAYGFSREHTGLLFWLCDVRIILALLSCRAGACSAGAV